MSKDVLRVEKLKTELANPVFLAKAPESIIAKKREQLAQLERKQEFSPLTTEATWKIAVWFRVSELLRENLQLCGQGVGTKVLDLVDNWLAGHVSDESFEQQYWPLSEKERIHTEKQIRVLREIVGLRPLLTTKFDEAWLVKLGNITSNLGTCVEDAEALVSTFRMNMYWGEVA